MIIANKMQTVFSRDTCMNRFLRFSTVYLRSGTRLNNLVQNDREQKFSCKSLASTEHLLCNKYMPSILGHVTINKSNVWNRHFLMTYTNVCKNTLYCGSGKALTGPLTLKPNYISVRQFQTDSIGSTSICGQLLDDTKLVVHMQDFLLWMHSTTGLPWWLTIVTTTILLRTAITFPLTIHQMYIGVKLQHLHMELKKLMPMYEAETEFQGRRQNWSRNKTKFEVMRKLRTKRAEMIINDNCHPAKISILMLVQLPMWITLSFSLRNIVSMAPKFDDNAYITFLEVSKGGIGWFDNLAVPDPYYILPILFGIANLSIIQLSRLTKSAPLTKLEKCVTYFFTGVIIIMVPVATQIPAIMSLYWATSSVYGLVQKVVLMSPKVQRTFRIPSKINEDPHPYATVWSKVQKKFKS